MIRTLGKTTIGFLKEVSNFFFLVRDILYWTIIAPFKGKRIRVESAAFQIIRVGIRAIPIICLVLFLVGMILVVAMSPLLVRFGVPSLIANIIAVSITREIGALLTALVMSGFAGASIAAEIGTMNVSEELMALETSALNPVAFLIVPRVLATAIALPCLVIISDIAGITGGMLTSKLLLGVSPSLYMQLTFEAIEIRILMYTVVKSFTFGMIIASLACYYGFKVRGGAEGVGKETTNSVVFSMIFIILANLVFSLFYNMYLEIY
ncbi:MAG: ABC transporter permease [Candidatus Omnitrophica bacterium]|nr:ABC transporter permease [Candidatus Omnitrophota bacterium]MBU1047144.1 ABC transporter permease [Candidatus Omnitrophota bacterium]MBU1630953.1 ABC transporter permease [Candidatus Omnitrophota bacterium]MBU1767498.1 ABC transporter permease [Candidatus Omnitrophota bacterium]MBU1889578.1 ABC transporter permease [Candidatus Omnitrophota bacterium]